MESGQLISRSGTEKKPQQCSAGEYIQRHGVPSFITTNYQFLPMQFIIVKSFFLSFFSLVGRASWETLETREHGCVFVVPLSFSRLFFPFNDDSPLPCFLVPGVFWYDPFVSQVYRKPTLPERRCVASWARVRRLASALSGEDEPAAVPSGVQEFPP